MVVVVVAHVSLVGVDRRRRSCRVGRGAPIVGAGATSAESNEEEATSTVPDGAQVSGEDVEEGVHPVTHTCWVWVAMRVQRWTTVVPVEVKRGPRAHQRLD